ncbi:MAG: glutamate-5-semialdehyde dehydrogenase [Eggerthellaceae bacterium]|nr:glutamate-5-semialdehyde dehydrogenase [Eggerthellaceae bacterium]
MSESSTQSVREIALAAKRAAMKLATTSAEERNHALRAMADALRQSTSAIVSANEQDMERERAAGMKESLLDRLMLDESRIEGMACALEDLATLPDPLGVVQQQRTLYNGIELTRVSVPLGVVAMVYEARPNVTADAGGICIKTGNAVVLRGGSAALLSNNLIADVLLEAAIAAGMPDDCIAAIKTSDRAATDELMSLHGIVDVLIPRGGAGLINHCVEHSKVPVIETGTGNCHVYVEASADFDSARAIIINSKCRRTGVCNAAETLLVDAAIADEFLPLIMADLAAQGVVMHVDTQALSIAQAAGIVEVDLATEKDWETEYLASEIAIKCVSGVEEAITHINTYGTKHSEAIVTTSDTAAENFLAAVDATSVYANAATSFTDGGQFGLGAEIGISTQKLHARGPFALEALTSYKYVLRGSGQVRD